VTLVFTHLPLKNREELAKLVAEHCAALEQGLKILDQHDGGGKFGPMDLLGVDVQRRLVVIDVSPRQADQLLVEGLAHVSWLWRNRHQIADVVADRQANLVLYPRLILVAPNFSPSFQEAIQGLRFMAIDSFSFRWLEAGGEKGLLLELAFSSWAKEQEKAGLEGPFPFLAEGFVPLNEEEIAAFMKMDSRFTR